MQRLWTLTAVVITSFGVGIADDVCVLPERNTLSSSCYGACKSSLCVTYAHAPLTAENGSKSSTDGNFFYRGCSTASISTCKTKVTSGKCELQCLVDKPTSWNNAHWTLTIAQPQSDKVDTAVFQKIDDLKLPPSLQNLTIAGATTSSQVTVPLSFSSNAFRSGTSLQQIVISDVSIGDMLTNIFPESLKSLIIQRAKLTQFDPRGPHVFTSVSILDLRENELSEIPTIIYEMRSLSALYLQNNAILNAHVTLPQLQYLQELPVFEADLTVHGSCSEGYEAVSWADKSVCYTHDVGLDSINSSGSNEMSTTSTASENDISSVVLVVVLGLTLFIILVVVGGVVLLQRWKQKAAKEQHDSFALSESKSKSNFMGFRALMGVSTMTQFTDLEASLNEYNTEGGLRKAVFREIPATDIVTLNQLSISGPVTVSLAEHRTELVLVTKLQTSDDDVEAALEMVPMLSQMRHPQLLSITGLVWDERLSMTAVCEYMTLGTLEAYLRGSGSTLNWANFKMKAAAEIARGLMYLHNKHTVTYDGLNGRSVFVDPKKGCKLNPVQAALPMGGSSPYSSQSYYRRCDSTNKAFFAPEILIGEPSRPSSDMYAFGVLLAHLDTCQTADEMIRSSWRMRTHIGDFDTENGTLLSTDGTVVSTTTFESELDNSRRRTQFEDLPSANSFHALHSSRSLNVEETRRRTTPLLGAHNNDNTSFMTLAWDSTFIPVVGSHRDDGINTFQLRPKGHFSSSSMGSSFECSDIRNGENIKNGEDIANPCAICLEEMEEDLAALVCGHVFHHTCVTQSLVRHPACPVCRRQASSQVRLYLSIGTREKRSSSNRTLFHSHRDGSPKAELNTNCHSPAQTVSRLAERMREMKVELDHVKEIQRMTSSHSFRLENKLVRLRQQQEQTKQQMQHIQQDLDRTNAKLRRSQRIGSLSLSGKAV